MTMIFAFASDDDDEDEDDDARGAVIARRFARPLARRFARTGTRTERVDVIVIEWRHRSTARRRVTDSRPAPHSSSLVVPRFAIRDARRDVPSASAFATEISPKRTTVGAATVRSAGILGACVLALGVLGVPAFVYDRIAMTGRYLTTTSDQELVVRREAHLSAEAFAALQKCALDHPKLRVEGSLNDSSFGKTRGFVVKFNEDGIERFRKNPDYACFVDVFDGLREPLTNAFVMNVLLCDLGDYDAYDAKEMSVDLHLDDTVGISSKHTFVAHQVSVLYVSVPEDMEGGQLELFSYGNGVVPPNAEPNDAVEPKENLMVTFRGDAFHRVRSYRTRSARERVSLVLEQYYIGDEHYAKTMAFEESCT